METMLELLRSPPILFGVALFLGLLGLVRVLLNSDGHLRRKATEERRKSGRMPPVPFYDSNRLLVTIDRRGHEDRRRGRIFTASQQLRH